MDLGISSNSSTHLQLISESGLYFAFQLGLTLVTLILNSVSRKPLLDTKYKR